MKLPLSVAYISFNEENIIGKSLESISEICSQIVVVDSFSTDNTINIAKDNNAEVYVENWKGFVEQKNSALSKCKYDWILLLDCDEIISKKLMEEISEIIIKNQIGAYSINRKTVYLGKMMNYSWQPDYVTRLIHKSLQPKFTGGKVHEKLEFKGNKSTKLKNEIIHYPYHNISHHFNKTIRYAELSAETYFDAKKTSSLFKLISNPIFAFINMYFLKFGILDSWRGLIAAFSSMTGTFLKYAELMDIEKNKKLHK